MKKWVPVILTLLPVKLGKSKRCVLRRSKTFFEIWYLAVKTAQLFC